MSFVFYLFLLQSKYITDTVYVPLLFYLFFCFKFEPPFYLKVAKAFNLSKTVKYFLSYKDPENKGMWQNYTVQISGRTTQMRSELQCTFISTKCVSNCIVSITTKRITNNNIIM